MENLESIVEKDDLREKREKILEDLQNYKLVEQKMLVFEKDAGRKRE